MDQFGLHAREATYNEVDVIMKLKRGFILYRYIRRNKNVVNI